MKINKLYNMDVVEGLPQMIKESLQVDCLITSPPYYSKRDYGIPPSIWDGDPECEHEWDNEILINEGSNWDTLEWNDGRPENASQGWKDKVKKSKATSQGSFCLKCGAWKGTLGLEPTIELYIKHLCDIYDLAYKVLKNTGTNWVNLGDTYSGGGGISCIPKDWDSISMSNRSKFPIHSPSKNLKNIPSKSLCLIPFRFSIEMINRGWILRNTIIWYKPNPMPTSARDRFTEDFEYVFFFVKSNKTQYWVNENTSQSILKKPLGRKGIEGIDWEWRECNKCFGTGIKHKKCRECKEEGYIYNNLLQPIQCLECKGLGRIRQDKECKSCKGKGIKKYSFWHGRHYWFEQQREPLSDNPSTQERYKYKVGNQTHRKDDGVKMVKSGKIFSKHFPQDLPKENLDFPILKYTSKELKNITKKKSGWQKERDKGINNRAKYQSREWTEWMEEVPLTPNPLGKNKRTVWTIPTYSNPENHFATFPPKLIEPMILSGCPEFICKKCGIPREKIIKSIGIPRNRQIGKQVHNGINSPEGRGDLSGSKLRKWKEKNPDKILGYSDCKCNSKYNNKNILPENATKSLLQERKKLKEIAKQQFPKSISQQQKFYNQHRDDPYKITKQKEIKGYTNCGHGSKWKSGIVLDIFAGTGTTLIEAWKLGRNYIGFEISKEYCEIAEKYLKQSENMRLDKFIYDKIKEVEQFE